MNDLEIEIVTDNLGKDLQTRGWDPNRIQDYLRSEADRVAQEIADEAGVEL